LVPAFQVLAESAVEKLEAAVVVVVVGPLAKASPRAKPRCEG
jgi:hypothetical protein